MKSAKEWANEVVDGPEEGHAATSRTRRDVILRDDDDYVMVYSASPVGQRGQHCEGCVADEELRGIIERLVERVQADAVDQATLRELDALADEMDRQCEYGIDDPGREYLTAIRLIRRLTKR